MFIYIKNEITSKQYIYIYIFLNKKYEYMNEWFISVSCKYLLQLVRDNQKAEFIAWALIVCHHCFFQFHKSSRSQTEHSWKIAEGDHTYWMPWYLSKESTQIHIILHVINRAQRKDNIKRDYCLARHII